jgi:hypothetical protein
MLSFRFHLSRLKKEISLSLSRKLFSHVKTENLKTSEFPSSHQQLIKHLDNLSKKQTFHPQISQLVRNFEVFSLMNTGMIEKRTITDQKKYVQSLPKINPRHVFTNDEIRYFIQIHLKYSNNLSSNLSSFDSIDTFGFDYDFTLSSYTEKVQEFIYTEALSYMVKELKYANRFAQVSF